MACDSPFYVLPKGGLEKVPVPCGRCPPCKLRRVNGWVFRLLQEEKRSATAHFVTLTYNTDHVPISSNGFMSLKKRDLQLYWKRLRKLQDAKIKYYAVGEYGTKNKRPHYHAIVFGVEKAEHFHTAWQLGDVHIGSVSGDSIAYTLKYIDKPPQAKHSRDDRVREFSLMSKSLGDNYISDEVRAYHGADVSRMYLTRPGGNVIAMPRYYRNKLYSDEQQEQQARIAQTVTARQEEQQRKQFALLGYKDYTFEQWQSSCRYGRHKHFYSCQKERQ